MLNSINVVISKALTNLCISHGEFVSVYVKRTWKYERSNQNLKTTTAHQRFQSMSETMLYNCFKCRKKKKLKTQRLQK